MEVKVQDAAVISADSAAPSGFSDKGPFDSLMPSGDRFSDATLAAPSSASITAARVQRELGHAVTRALASLHEAASALGWRSTGSCDEGNGWIWHREHMFARSPDVRQR